VSSVGERRGAIAFMAALFSLVHARRYLYCPQALKFGTLIE
jgi:hypothetical protein